MTIYPTERRQGLKARARYLNACGTIIIGARYGVSEGMAAEINVATGKTSNYSYLGGTHEQIRPNTPHE